MVTTRNWSESNARDQIIKRFPQLPSLSISPKFWCPLSSTQVFVMSRKPGGGKGGVIQEYVYNSGDTGATGLCETWRPRRKYDLAGAALLRSNPSAVGGSGWSEASASATTCGFVGATASAQYPAALTSQSTPRRWDTVTLNNSRTFLLYADRRGVIRIPFILTSTGGVATVTDTETSTVLATVDLKRPSAANNDILSIVNIRGKYGLTSGVIAGQSIKIELTGAGKLSLLGGQIFMLEDDDTILEEIYDAYVYFRTDNGYTESNAVGASDYAFRRSGDNYYVGSWHKYERAIDPAKMWFDGVNDDTVATTLFRAFKNFRLDQHTIIEWPTGTDTLELRTNTLLRGDGSAFLTGYGVASSNLILDYAYLSLHTTALAFNKVEFPRYTDVSTVGDYTFDRCDGLIQLNPLTNQRVSHYYSYGEDDFSPEGGYFVRTTAGQYSKFYGGPAVGTAKPISTLSWHYLTVCE